MDFTITKEQQEYIHEIKLFAQHNLNESKDMDCFSRELWKKIADMGLFLFNIEEKYGGLGESYVTAALCIEALGYSCKNNGLIFAINNHLWVALNLINLYGKSNLKDKYIADMCNGKKIGCFALTEADSGSDALSMYSNVKTEGDYFVLNGSKMFVSNGPIADIYIVIAKNLDSNGGYTALVVEREFEGVVVGNEIKKMGLHSCPTGELAFNNVKVPKENILGRHGMGEIIMTVTLEWERCFECAPHIGTMQRIMEQCINYARTRKQHGKGIIEYQAVSHKIADMKVAIEVGKLMLYKIAYMKDCKQNAFMESSIFKLFVSENYVKVCQNALQIFGGYGYCQEYVMEREVRDSMASTIYSGTSEIQRNTISELASIFV